MTDLDRSAPNFQHRYASNGRVESICLHCWLPVSNAYTLRDLTRAEIAHHCQQSGWSRPGGASFSGNVSQQERQCALK
jgi:hypothetical protein